MLRIKLSDFIYLRFKIEVKETLIKQNKSIFSNFDFSSDLGWSLRIIFSGMTELDSYGFERALREQCNDLLLISRFKIIIKLLFKKCH